jgi:hypothetical protein
MGILKDWKEFREYQKGTLQLRLEREAIEQAQKVEEEKKRKDIVLIYQYSANWTRNTPYGKKEFKLISNLYENALGERSFECSSTLGDKEAEILDMLRKDTEYITSIMPWLKGAYISKFPSFEDKQKDIMVSKLKK